MEQEKENPSAKSIETLEGYLDRLKGYTQKFAYLREKKQFFQNRS